VCGEFGGMLVGDSGGQHPTSYIQLYAERVAHRDG
jgi:hypothetical protein